MSLAAAGFTVILLHMFFNRAYLRIDEDEHGGKFALMQEGAMPAAATFMVRIQFNLIDHRQVSPNSFVRLTD